MSDENLYRQATSEGFESIGDGRKVTAAAGTRLTLVASSTPARRVIIQGLEGNTDSVVFGGVTIDETLASRSGIELDAEDTYEFSVPGGDLINIYIDSAVTGEGVSFVYFN